MADKCIADGNNCRKELSYKTFDAVEMRKTLEAKINIDETIMLCSLGIKVGNNYGNLFPPNIANLQRRLNIKKKAKDDHEAVTLTRIMACFPEVTIALVHKQGSPIIVPYEELKLVHPEFPIIATTQVAAAVLPSTLNVEETCKALDLILVSQLKISEKSRWRDISWMNMSPGTKSSTISQYVINSYKSTVLSDGDKSRLAVEYGIVSSDGGLSRAWAEAGAAAKEWLYDTGYGSNIKPLYLNYQHHQRRFERLLRVLELIGAPAELATKNPFRNFDFHKPIFKVKRNLF